MNFYQNGRKMIEGYYACSPVLPDSSLEDFGEVFLASSSSGVKCIVNVYSNRFVGLLDLEDEEVSDAEELWQKVLKKIPSAWNTGSKAQFHREMMRQKLQLIR